LVNSEPQLLAVTAEMSESEAAQIGLRTRCM
jgi:hypothetical protein